VQEAQLAPLDISVDSPQNVIPFPTSTGIAGLPDDGPLQLGPPGQYSHTRERFMYTDPERSRPRSASAGHDGYTASFSPSPTPISSPHPGVPSPTFFYTSMPSSDVIAPLQDHQIRQPSAHPGYFSVDTMGRAHDFPGNHSEGYNMEHSHSSEQGNRLPAGSSVTWEGETPVAQGAHHECYYCPSRGASSDCYTYPPRSSLYSPPVQRSSIVPPSLPLSPPAPMVGAGYNYNNRHALSTNHAMNMNMANSFEQSMIPPSRSTTSEAWFSPLSMVPHGFHGVQFYPPPVQVPSTSYGNYTSLKPEPPLHTNDTIFRSNSSSSPPLPRLTGRATSPRSSTNNPRESSTLPERNQLNLARIEDGQDTRTTVMIKNIPNKMSDKDLIAFIAKVCARKIDFLYLRMDFQNGMSLVRIFDDCLCIDYKGAMLDTHL
jgi:RNA recognition motif 2